MSELNNNVTANNNNQEVSTMNKSEMIRQYVAANPTPDQDLCPEIIQYWRTSNKGFMNWSSKSGSRWDHGTNWAVGTNAHYYSVRSYNYDGIYVKYIPELKCLEIARIYMTGGRGKDGEVRDWHFGTNNYLGKARVFAFKGDTVAYDSEGNLLCDKTYGETYGKVSEGKYYCPLFLKAIHYGTLSGNVCNSEAAIEQCHKMGLNIAKDSGGWMVIRDLENYYQKEWTPRKVSKMAKKVDEYVLPDPNFEEVPKDMHEAIVVQMMSDEEYIVLRRYDQKCRYDVSIKDYRYDSEWNERYRIFINKKGKPTVVRKHWGEQKWRISTASISQWHNNNKPCVYVVDEELISKWKPLMYLKEIVNFHTSNCLDELVTVLRHPIIEQLLKAGYPKIAKELSDSNQITANLKAYFRCDSERKLPLYKLLGVNKWLLKAVEEYEFKHHHYYSNEKLRIIYQIKFMYDRFDLNDLSKETIEMILHGLDRMEYSSLREIFGYSDWSYRRTRWLEVNDDQRAMLFKLFRISEKENVNAMQLYVDIMRTYDRIVNKPDVNLNRFDDMHGLQILHDALVEIKNMEDIQRKKDEYALYQKSFDKLQKERIEKYNAESEKYLIKVPDALEEITKEGCSLNHCVGGYIQTHASGNTTILFLRKKSDPNTSFYTIEVRDGRLVQIHGSHNKWLGNDPEPIPFVYKWLKERGIIFDEAILLNLGAGYCRDQKSLDRSYLSKEVV